MSEIPLSEEELIGLLTVEARLAAQRFARIDGFEKLSDQDFAQTYQLAFEVIRTLSEGVQEEDFHTEFFHSLSVFFQSPVSKKAISSVAKLPEVFLSLLIKIIQRYQVTSLSESLNKHLNPDHLGLNTYIGAFFPQRRSMLSRKSEAIDYQALFNPGDSGGMHEPDFPRHLIWLRNKKFHESQKFPLEAVGRYFTEFAWLFFAATKLAEPELTYALASRLVHGTSALVIHRKSSEDIWSDKKPASFFNIKFHDPKSDETISFDNLVQRRPPHRLAFIGRGGAGKSIHATRIAQSLVNNNHYQVVIKILHGNSSTCLYQVLEKLCDVRILRTINKRILLLIDDFDVPESEESTQLLQKFRRLCSDNPEMGLIVNTRYREDVMTDYLHIFHVLPVDVKDLSGWQKQLLQHSADLFRTPLFLNLLGQKDSLPPHPHDLFRLFLEKQPDWNPSLNLQLSELAYKMVELNKTAISLREARCLLDHNINFLRKPTTGLILRKTHDTIQFNHNMWRDYFLSRKLENVPADERVDILIKLTKQNRANENAESFILILPSLFKERKTLSPFEDLPLPILAESAELSKCPEVKREFSSLYNLKFSRALKKTLLGGSNIDECFQALIRCELPDELKITLDHLISDDRIDKLIRELDSLHKLPKSYVKILTAHLPATHTPTRLQCWRKLICLITKSPENRPLKESDTITSNDVLSEEDKRFLELAGMKPTPTCSHEEHLHAITDCLLHCWRELVPRFLPEKILSPAERRKLIDRLCSRKKYDSLLLLCDMLETLESDSVYTVLDKLIGHSNEKDACHPLKSFVNKFASTLSGDEKRGLLSSIAVSRQPILLSCFFELEKHRLEMIDCFTSIKMDSRDSAQDAFWVLTSEPSLCRNIPFEVVEKILETLDTHVNPDEVLPFLRIVLNNLDDYHVQKTKYQNLLERYHQLALKKGMYSQAWQVLAYLQNPIEPFSAAIQMINNLNTDIRGTQILASGLESIFMRQYYAEDDSQWKNLFHYLINNLAGNSSRFEKLLFAVHNDGLREALLLRLASVSPLDAISVCLIFRLGDELRQQHPAASPSPDAVNSASGLHYQFRDDSIIEKSVEFLLDKPCTNTLAHGAQLLCETDGYIRYLLTILFSSPDILNRLPVSASELLNIMLRKLDENDLFENTFRFVGTFGRLLGNHDFVPLLRVLQIEDIRRLLVLINQQVRLLPTRIEDIAVELHQKKEIRILRDWMIQNAQVFRQSSRITPYHAIVMAHERNDTESVSALQQTFTDSAAGSEIPCKSDESQADFPEQGVIH